MGGPCSINVQSRESYSTLVLKSKRNSSLSRPSRRCECRIILKLVHKCEAGGIDWNKLIQDVDRCLALVNVIMELRSIKCKVYKYNNFEHKHFNT